MALIWFENHQIIHNSRIFFFWVYYTSFDQKQTTSVSKTTNKYARWPCTKIHHNYHERYLCNRFALRFEFQVRHSIRAPSKDYSLCTNKSEGIAEYDSYQTLQSSYFTKMFSDMKGFFFLDQMVFREDPSK